MADQAVKIPVELEIRNLEEMVRKASQGLSETQLTASGSRNDQMGNIEKFYDMMNKITNVFRGLPGSDASPETKAAFGLMKGAEGASDKVADDIMKIMKTGIGIIEDIHARLKQSSPLLQSVESLFNLAVQLFFMPLGNKLATVLLPAVLELVDDVMELWNKVEGMDLGEMLNEMINYGAEIFGQFFQNLGESLAEQSGIAGSIGRVLVGMGDFIENHLADLIKIIADVLKFIMDNLGTLVNAFIEFKILSLSLQMAQLGAAMAGPLGGIAGLAIGEIAGHAVVSSTGVYDATAKMAASGAYVGATEGGRSVTVAEGGEGEFIMPESRLQSMMGSISDRMVDVASAQPDLSRSERGENQTINNYFTINGYTDRELTDMVRRTVNEQVSQSKLRSGF